MSIAVHVPDVAEQTLGVRLLEPVTLDEVVERASLMTRVDRKYLVPVDAAVRLIDRLSSSHASLEIGGRRSTTYHSTYFDTADLDSVRAHVQRRRLRWKIRQRWYVEDGLCRLEVKTKNGRGETIKSFAPSDVEGYGRLADRDAVFVESVLRGDHPGLRVRDMQPAAEIRYCRATLVDLAAGHRVTVDWGLIASLRHGEAHLDDSVVLVETKGGPAPAVADRILRQLGVRPRAFSKYAATSALIRDDVRDNDVRQLRDTVLHIRQPIPEGAS